MLDFFKEIYTGKAGGWIKWLALAGGIVYAVLYMTSCAAGYKATFKTTGPNDTITMTYSVVGRVKR